MKEIECTTENVVIFVILYLVLYYITALVVMFFNKKAGFVGEVHRPDGSVQLLRKDTPIER